ncbi:MAG: 2-iminoacetate synthase ThiH [Desulfurivibrionaceae bacterium]
MFSIPSFSELADFFSDCSIEDVDRACRARQQGRSLEFRDLAALLSPAADLHLSTLSRQSAELTEKRFGRIIQLYAPLYLSNYCANRCQYCGFSADNRIERRILSLEEAEEEAMILEDRGFNHILLVSGEAPEKLGVDYLTELARRISDRFAAISIEVQPLSREEYTRLFEAGITGVAVYQETYDREVYSRVHLGGRKTDYDYRLATLERAASSGMREVGVGVLLGLADWRLEGLALGMHLSYLRKYFWQTALTVSFPRIRPAAGDFQSLVPVGEQELAHLIFALRIFDPDVGLIVSTREEPRFRNGMIGLGPTRYSADSCTMPGGYSNPELKGEQFAIGDQRSLPEICEAILGKGYDPVRKDWDAVLQSPEGKTGPLEGELRNEISDS